MKLRDYQVDAVAACWKAWEQHQRVMLVLPTGTGKTEIFVSLASDWKDGRVMVIAPMIELIGQAARKISQRTGVMPGIEQGSNRSNEHELCRSPFVVASKQTLTGVSERYKRFEDIGLVIIDECHLAATKKYKEMLDYYAQRGAKILGVTATPKRHDEIAMGNLFDECAYQLSIQQAVAQGWLVPAKAQCVEVKSLDLSAVGSSKGDFKNEELAKVMEDEKVVHEIASITAQEHRGEKTVVFCASVNEARAVSDVLNDRYGLHSEWVCGDARLCPKHERHVRLKKFTEGDVGVVCNVGVLTTGWDFPGLKHIVMARPTKSLPLYTQIFGRGTRPLAGVVDFEDSTAASRRAAIEASDKPHFRITDLRDNSLRHKLVTAVDVLGGKDLSDAVRRRAALVMAAGVADVQETLEQVTAELRKEREEADRRRLAAMQARAQYDRRDVDPFDLASSATTPQRHRSKTRMPFGKHKGKSLSEVPTGYLEWLHNQGRRGWLHNLITAELQQRGRVAQPPPPKAEQVQLDFFSSLREKIHAAG